MAAVGFVAALPHANPGGGGVDSCRLFIVNFFFFFSIPPSPLPPPPRPLHQPIQSPKPKQVKSLSSIRQRNWANGGRENSNCRMLGDLELKLELKSMLLHKTERMEGRGVSGGWAGIGWTRADSENKEFGMGFVFPGERARAGCAGGGRMKAAVAGLSDARGAVEMEDFRFSSGWARRRGRRALLRGSGVRCCEQEVRAVARWLGDGELQGGGLGWISDLVRFESGANGAPTSSLEGKRGWVPAMGCGGGRRWRGVEADGAPARGSETRSGSRSKREKELFFFSFDDFAPASSLVSI